MKSKNVSTGKCTADRCLLWLTGIATMLFLLVWIAPIPTAQIKITNYVPWHSLLEIFSISVASTIFAIGWHARLNKEVSSNVVLALVFLAVALFDAEHLLSYSGMPDWLTKSSPEKAIYFWLLARYTAALALLALVLTSAKKLSWRFSATAVIAVVLLYTIALSWLILHNSEYLPRLFVVGSGLTGLKVGLEWLLILISVVTLILVFRQRSSPTPYNSAALIAALYFSTLSEMCFTLYSDVADIFNILGHIYKVISYGFLFQAVVLANIKQPHILLAESRNTLRQLTDNIRQVFWTSSLDKKKIFYVSPAYEEIWGCSVDSLYKDPLSWTNLVHEDDKEKVAEKIFSQAEGSYTVEYRIVRPDGEERWVRDRAFPVTSDDNEDKRIVGVAEDITVEKNNASLLQLSEARLKAILRTASDGIHIINSEGRLIDSSDSFLDSLGYDRSWIGRMFVWEWDSNYSPSEILQNIQALCDSEGSRTFETVHRKKDGELIDVEVSVRGFTIAGEKLLYASSRVITERKLAENERLRLQAQLVQAQKMEAIGQLTGGIAHDFNNMLGAMLGFAELIERKCDSSTDPKIHRYSSEIIAAGKRAKELVAQMMLFSRTRPGEDETPVTILLPILKEVLDLLRSTIPSTVNINFDMEDNEFRVKIHPVQLHQIILNLVINARDAISEYGSITISVSQQTGVSTCDSCYQSIDGTYVAISVKDNGQGMSEDVRLKIFNPFFTTKEVGKGTGMGLSVIHGIVHGIGGHIQVKSEIGSGSEVCVFLPQLTDTAHETEQERPRIAEIEQLSHLRIMVVDDEEAMATMLREFLQMYGAIVSVYTQPEMALTAFKQHPDTFDVIITDETMPRLTGFDLAKTMLAIRGNIPIILCTGYSDSVNEDNARSSGIREFMYKPIDLDKLRSLMTQLCESEPGSGKRDAV